MAVFTVKTVTVGEAAGNARLEVQLAGGGPTCEGTVHYKTVDGTAKAPGDYVKKEGELRYTAGDDRKEPITIPIVNDKLREPQESFKVQLSRGAMPGNITPESSPATVRINDDNDPAPSPTATATATSTATATATATATESVTASPTPTETPTESLTPTPAGTDTGVAAPEGTSGGGSNWGAIAAIVGAIVLLGGAGFLWSWRRRSGFG